MRIAVGGITFEANSFCSHVADMADFQARGIHRGAEILAGWRDQGTSLAGAMHVLTRSRSTYVFPTMLARSLSAAPIEAATFQSLLDELCQRLADLPDLDGVYLVLHGAMMSEQYDDATGELLARVRQAVGDIPITGSMDLHANVTRRMVEQATALVGYHTAPHIDMYEAGRRAAELLVGTIRGEISPTVGLVRLPMLCPPENSTHRAPPLGTVIDRVLELEASGDILHGSVFPVQPWMDGPDVASSVMVYTDNDADAAQSYAQEMGETFWSLRREFVTELVPPAEAVARALARESGTVILCDSADATTSGSTGDSTALLRAVAKMDLGANLAMLNIVDAPAVTEAIGVGVGETVTLQIGGTRAPDVYQPVELTARVKTISDGEFVFKGPGMRGVPHHMGRAVVLATGGPADGLRLVMMERPVSQWDPELYRSMGLEPTDARIVQVKSPRAFRAGYEGIFDEVIVLDAPGAANPKLTELPWKRLGRPIYPLDEDASWS